MAKWIIALVFCIGVMQGQTITVLHAFTGTDGANPAAGLLRDPSGNLYGSTGWGGAYGWGTIFKVDTNNVETVLYSFTGGADGSYPTGLLLDKAGNLYGTESGCDGYGYCPGTVFKVDATGKQTILYAFTGGRDGNGPEAGLVRDNSGNLYGTTSYGGDVGRCTKGSMMSFARPPILFPPNGCGVIFKLSPGGKETVLYRFTGGPDGGDGAYPAARLVRDSVGNLYGTTVYGGDLIYSPCEQSEYFGCGTVFKLSWSGKWKENRLYTFEGSTNGDGEFPTTALARDANGNLYGVAAGGAYDLGMVFKLNTNGDRAILHNFTGSGGDGASPLAALIADVSGNLYGTTSAGGVYGYGTAFKMDTTGSETVLYSFTGGTDGARPEAALIRESNGNLYGTTLLGGDLNCNPPYGCGTVFEIAP
jgi:uncharacterized repeat protein (TIGR03803 family)